MDRVLALQGLTDSSNYDVEPLASSNSDICSSESSGPGRSSCSGSCREAEEMDW